MRNTGLQNKILEIMPDFCWQTAFEILTAYELLDEVTEVLPACVMIILLRLIKKGKIKRRKIYRSHTGFLVYEYIKK